VSNPTAASRQSRQVAQLVGRTRLPDRRVILGSPDCTNRSFTTMAAVSLRTRPEFIDRHVFTVFETP
jgi:hypothetical protein